MYTWLFSSVGRLSLFFMSRTWNNVNRNLIHKRCVVSTSACTRRVIWSVRMTPCFVSGWFENHWDQNISRHDGYTLQHCTDHAKFFKVWSILVKMFQMHLKNSDTNHKCRHNDHNIWIIHVTNSDWSTNITFQHESSTWQAFVIKRKFMTDVQLIIESLTLM